MARRKKFKDRINDLSIQYGSRKALAESLNVSERTIYNWLKRDDAPKGIDKTLKDRTGNSRAIKDREYYFRVQKPKREYRKRTKTVPYELQEGALIERPIILFDSLDVSNQITLLTKSNKFKAGNKYQITVNIRNPKTLEQWDIIRKINGSQIKSKDQITSLAWQFLRQAYKVEESENLQITLTGMQAI
ncbi:MAG TPA: helix-turn-helix domain-containing protein [Bacteroidales bacterium]|nr:helix-turn-helix domain-containing protein [Bacteroidales bacterium]